MSNNMRLELRSYVTCTDINVIYCLKYNMCDNKEMYIGKTVCDDVVGVKVELISILVIVEQVLPLVNFRYTYITVP